jgi:hypothetical protein
MNKFGGAKIYMKLDLRDTYYKIRIKNNDKWKTAFRTHYDYYKYIVIFFGLINIPATFQIYVNKTLRELLNEIYVAFIDDILIYNNSEKKYARHVRQILDQLKIYDLFAKLSKCEFFITEMKFLDFIINIEDIKIDPRRIQIIDE